MDTRIIIKPGLDVARHSGTLYSGLPEMRTFSEQKEGTQRLNGQVLMLLGTVELSDYLDKHA